MKEHITKGIIRKITIGDLKNGMNYYNKNKICSIFIL